MTTRGRGAAGAACVAWALLLAGGGCGEDLRGGVSVDWRSAGKQWSTTPDACVAGDRQGFFGVDMRAGGSDAALVRVAIDPGDGAVVRFNVPGTDQALYLNHQAACSRFDVHVERVERVEGGSDMRGHLRVDCDDPGLALRADIRFERCH